LEFQNAYVLETSVVGVHNTNLDPMNECDSKACGYLSIHTLSIFRAILVRLLFFVPRESTKETPDWDIRATLTE